MVRTAGIGSKLLQWLIVLTALLATCLPAMSTTEHPLEPPDRSSPRATLMSFLNSLDRAWDLYSTGEGDYKTHFREGRECLDLSEIPPLVFYSGSAKKALTLKEVLDRLKLPAWNEVPDASMVDELEIKRWTLPHTEIQLYQVAEGQYQGQWLFAVETVSKAEDFYERVKHLPYQPGRTGGHVEELRVVSQARFLMKLVSVMPPWFRSEIGEMLVWQWFGLFLLVISLVIGNMVAAWIGRRWYDSQMPGRALGASLLPLMMLATPFLGRAMIHRLFALPGNSALVLRLGFSVVGFLGLAWFAAQVLMRVGEITVGTWFRNARPLRKQLVRVIFRIATIITVTVISIMGMQRLGVPIAGLVAGVSVGGLAIALAAQSSLENFIGGIILYTDQPVKVGDFCKFGDNRGVIEDVGLRSVKIRTLDRTVVSVPNADFAKMQLENLAKRDRILLKEKLRLQYETTREQLQNVMAALESMLIENDRIDEEPLRVRFIGFGEYFLEVEVYAYTLTTDWAEFLEIREDILMQVMAIIEGSGTRLALPTEIRKVKGQDRPAEA